jgi:hypothetical protein
MVSLQSALGEFGGVGGVEGGGHSEGIYDGYSILTPPKFFTQRRR